MHLFKQFDQPHDIPVAVLNGALSTGTLSLAGDGWTGTIEDGHLKAKNGDQSIDLQHITRSSPTLGIKPPKGAIVLFDGTNMESLSKMTEKEWLTEDGPCKWHLVLGDAVESVPRSGNCIGKRAFGDAKIHVEFRTIGGPTNSGVYIQDRYEANINETYGSLSANPNGSSIIPSGPSRAFVPRGRYLSGRPSTWSSRLHDSIRLVRRLPMQW